MGLARARTHGTSLPLPQAWLDGERAIATQHRVGVLHALCASRAFGAIFVDGGAFTGDAEWDVIQTHCGHATWVALHDTHAKTAKMLATARAAPEAWEVVYEEWENGTSRASQRFGALSLNLGGGGGINSGPRLAHGNFALLRNKRHADCAAAYEPVVPLSSLVGNGPPHGPPAPLSSSLTLTPNPNSNRASQLRARASTRSSAHKDPALAREAADGDDAERAEVEVEARFKRLDVNGDGAITMDEWRAARHTSPLATQGQGRSAPKPAHKGTLGAAPRAAKAAPQNAPEAAAQAGAPPVTPPEEATWSKPWRGGIADYVWHLLG